MPSSWNQLKQSGFPLSDYAKEMPIGEYEVIVDGVCYAKSGSRIGTGIHVFARIRERKHWFFVHYLPGHASYLRAKQLTAGDHVRLIVEAGRNGRGLIKDVVPGTGGKIKPPIRCDRSRVSGRGEDGANGRAKPGGSGKLCWFAAVPKTGAARTRRREGCKGARSGRGCARVFREIAFIGTAPEAGKAGQSARFRVSIP